MFLGRFISEEFIIVEGFGLFFWWTTPVDGFMGQAQRAIDP